LQKKVPEMVPARDGDPADHPMAMGAATPSQIRWPPHGHGVAVDGMVVLVAVLILFFVFGVLFSF
jgi:hypothetical protein